MNFNCPSTKEYTSLKHFKIKHSNPKRQKELRELVDGGYSFPVFKQMIKRDVVEFCFEKDLEIFRITKKFKRCLKWMLGKGMLPDFRKCPCCDFPMRLANSFAKMTDGVWFKCSRHDGRDIKMSIREGTIFDGCMLTLMESLRVVFYYFSRGFNAL